MSISQTAKMNRLSKRECQILNQLKSGLPNKIIGRNLFITEATVKFHCKNIYKKLNVRCRGEILAREIRKLEVAETGTAAHNPT